MRILSASCGPHAVIFCNSDRRFGSAATGTVADTREPRSLELSELDKMLRLDGQVALVTGGSAGIGKAIARLLSAAGAAVCVVARDQTRVDATVAELEAAGGRVIGVAGSAVEAETRERSVRRCIEELGSLDILVNNVGLSPPSTPLAQTDEETVRSLLELNLEAPLFYSQLAWRRWMAGHGGSIVNITSASGLQPRHGYGWYGVTKAALGFLTKVMALEFAPTVRVNAVAPGTIMTELLMTRTTPEFREMALSTRPLRRIGDPEHIASNVLALVAPSGGYTTGHEVAVDGGSLLV
jgi:NAD(P)-dependent dehydrogenase (short-subunit alcohol dehydrogenase family)